MLLTYGPVHLQEVLLTVPSAAVVLSVGHALHAAIEVPPSPGWYVPLGQGLHTPSEEYFPAAHAAHTPSAAPQVPGGHTPQDLPVPEYPVLQVHVDVSAVEPAAHVVSCLAWASHATHRAHANPVP
jgi:hypothetical protein